MLEVHEGGIEPELARILESLRRRDLDKFAAASRG